MKTWHNLMSARLARREKDVPWFLGEKIAAYKYLDEIGAPHSQILGVYESISEVPFQDLPHSFVIKPTREDSMRGVLVLQRQGENLFYDELRTRTVTQEQVIQEFDSLFEKHQHKNNRIIVEEYVRDSDGFIVPRDFKFYAFRGEIAIILEINRNTRPLTVSWYDSQFQPVADGRIAVNEKYANHVPGRRPAGWREMIEVASIVSRNIPTPFASIDMYSSTRGPLVGEITLTPGGIYYGGYKLSEALEIKMGAMWEIASQDNRLFQKPKPR